MNPPPPPLYVAWDKKLKGMLPDAALHCGPRPTALWTTPRQDVSRARVGCNDSKTGRKRESRKGRAATDFLTKKHQNGRQNIIF